MKHDLDETIIAAIMGNEPLIIVEGQDDIKFYSNIAEKSNCSVNVQAVETIDGYVEGCNGVIKAIEDAQELMIADQRIKNYVLGIVDRDARYYLNTIPDLNNLLILKYYSYESHLITSKSIRKLLGIMTKANKELLTDEAIQFIKSDFESGLSKLYYFSLEALKSRCYPDYETCITYGDKSGHFLNRGAIDYYWNLILPKKCDLDQFAMDIGITIDNVRQIANGKWYLHYWCEYIIQESKKFHELCGNGLPECQYCKIGEKKKCLWRQASIFQIPNIKSILYSEEIIDLDEVRYIINKMKELAS